MAVDKQKERRKVVRAQNYRRNQAQKEAEKKAAAEKPVDKTPDIPAKLVNSQTVNIVMNGNINVQVIGESSQSTDLEQVLTNFKAKPYSKDAHIVISKDDLEVPAKYTSKDSILPETEYDPNDHYFDDTDEISLNTTTSIFHPMYGYCETIHESTIEGQS